jgi:hypothetical protein
MADFPQLAVLTLSVFFVALPTLIDVVWQYFLSLRFSYANLPSHQKKETALHRGVLSSEN